MRSVNKVILIGNLTRDPELRQTPNGQSVCTFGIATNREWVTKDGSGHNLAEFHEVVAWAHLAEICNKFLKKGNLIYLEGYLKTRNWDTPEGVKKFKTEIIIQDMIMLEKRKKDGGGREEYIPEEDISEMEANEKNIEEQKMTEESKEKKKENKSKATDVDINEDLGL